MTDAPNRISKLIDQFGNPIPPDQIARLREPQATATLAGVRPVVSGFPADGMTPAKLAAIHRAAAEGDSLAYMELAEDIEERDLHYLAVLSTRRRQVSQLPIQVEAVSEDPEHERHAELVRRWIKRGVLENALFDMLDAIGKGYSVTEIDWEVGPDGILPRKLEYRSPRWFEVSRGDGETVMMRDLSVEALQQIVPSGLVVVPGAAYPGQIGLVPLTRHKFIVHRHRAKSGILLRAGVARVASWAWMYKAFTLRDWAVFVQNYGMPIRVGKYGPSSSPADRDVLWSAVANIAGDCAAIIPDSMIIEFQKMEGTQAAAELYERRCAWLDQQMSKLILGQTTTTDAVSGGHAVAKEHRLVQEDIERADARGLSVSITEQLVALIVAFNFPAYISGGGRDVPRVLIGRPDETALDDIVKTLQWLGPQGLTVTAKQLRGRIGFDEPAEGDEVVGGAPPPPPVPVVSPPQVTRTKEAPFDPKTEPPEQVAKQALSVRTELPAAVDPELIDALTRRLALDAQGALTGLTDQVRDAIDAASDMQDLWDRLESLQLDPAAFQSAMQRGMAVGFLTGQAALLDEIKRGLA